MHFVVVVGQNSFSHQCRDAVQTGRRDERRLCLKSCYGPESDEHEPLLPRFQTSSSSEFSCELLRQQR